MNLLNWRAYTFEFLSIFVAVIAAFALNNWNDNRKDRIAETKILAEIANGLKKDLDDIEVNIMGHKQGMAACDYFRNLMLGEEVPLDSLEDYFMAITRDFVNVQNSTGYETLKSRGLELIRDDGLRGDIISIYEYDYQTLRKLEEDYFENQFQHNYFEAFSKLIADDLIFSEEGRIIDIQSPLTLDESQRQLLQTYLWKIGANRFFMLRLYFKVKENVKELIQVIDQ